MRPSSASGRNASKASSSSSSAQNGLNTPSRGSHHHHHHNNNATMNHHQHSTASSSNVFCLQSIRCTLPSCSCQCFEPGTKQGNQVRICDGCNHSWVVHALDKLRVSNPYQMAHAEPVTSSSAFDVASLALYGTRAIPIRVKVLLDRIFAQLPPDHLLQLLARLNWSHDDYIRGYVQLDAASGTPIDHWTMATRDEEAIIIQQFFRFAETKSIAHELLLQDAKDRQDSFQQALSLHSAVGGAESHIRRFLEASGLGAVAGGAQNILQASALASALGSFAGSNFSGAAFPGLVAVQQAAAVATPVQLAQRAVQATPSLPLFQQPQQRQPQPFANNQQQQQQPETPSGLPLNLTKKDRSSSINSNVTPNHIQNYAMKSSATSRLSLITPDERQSGDESNVVDESPMNHRDMKPHHSSSSHINRSSLGSIDRASYGYGGTIVSPTTGKKRVLCQACGKTFCDKGALKIHYSAVHLREMHRCTIQGCNMYFSSRRSRNRHSANPNPKLHSPYRQRVVIDGRSGSDGANGAFEDNASSTSENRRNVDANNSTVSDGEEREMDAIAVDDGEMMAADACVVDEDDIDEQKVIQNNKRSSFVITAGSQSDDENGTGVEGSLSSYQDGTLVISTAPAAAKRRKSAAPVRVVRFHPEDQDEDVLDMREKPEFMIREDGEVSLSPLPDGRVMSPSNFSETSEGDQSALMMASGDQHVEPSIEIPVDPNNPRQCSTCKKIFQNPFSMRLHYQNVHLKVKHYCTVPGCNSVFPSKRSRDRHSSNANLHRRMSLGNGTGSADLNGGSPSLSPSQCCANSIDASLVSPPPPLAHNSTGSASSTSTASPPFASSSFHHKTLLHGESLVLPKEESDWGVVSQSSDKSSQPAITAV